MSDLADPESWENARRLLDSHLLSLGASPRSRAFLARFINKWKSEHGDDAQSAGKMLDHLMRQDHPLSYLEQMANPGE